MSTETTAKAATKQAWFLVVCWAVTIIVTSFAAFDLIVGLTRAESAPQQAAVGAIAAAQAVVPYVFTRAVEGLLKR